MSSSVIGSAHAPAWLEPVEDPPRRAARTARLARRAVAGDAGTHIDRVQQASSDRRHSTRRHGRRGNAGVPPRAPVTQSLYKGRLRCPRPTHQGALAFHLDRHVQAAQQGGARDLPGTLLPCMVYRGAEQ